MDEFLKEHPSLSDRIFEIIEKAILSGSIKPGERIVETELAKKLGISKSPVREALKKLEGEGIVRLVPRKGFFVRQIDRKNIEDFYDVVSIIEVAGARLSLKRKTDAICKEMDEILNGMKRHLRKREYGAYLQLNHKFHGLFYDLTENEWIIKISQMLFKQADMLRSLSLLSRDRFAHSIEEHIAIGEAFKKGDEELLVHAVKHHLIMFKENILKSDYVKNNLA
jgi:DNA-binding GntR family transcriptional regulator